MVRHRLLRLTGLNASKSRKRASQSPSKQQKRLEFGADRLLEAESTVVAIIRAYLFRASLLSSPEHHGSARVARRGCEESSCPLAPNRSRTVRTTTRVACLYGPFARSDVIGQ